MPQHDTRPRKPAIPLEVFKRLRPGDSITYLLSPSQGPTNPHREWHGRIECVLEDHVTVTSLDEGYLEETERVWRSRL
jgi:ribosomal protein L21E